MRQEPEQGGRTDRERGHAEHREPTSGGRERAAPSARDVGLEQRHLALERCWRTPRTGRLARRGLASRRGSRRGRRWAQTTEAPASHRRGKRNDGERGRDIRQRTTEIARHDHPIDVLGERVDRGRVGARREDQQRADFAEAAREPPPPIAPEYEVCRDGLAPARQNEELLRVVDGTRDLVERDAVGQAVGDTRRVAVAQRSERGGVANEIRHRHAPARRLRSRDAERDPRGGLAVAPRHEDRTRVVQCGAYAEPFVEPGRRSSRGGRAHGAPP